MRKEECDGTAALRGMGALKTMLDLLGETADDKPDQVCAKILVDNEMDLRELLAYAMREMLENL